MLETSIGKSGEVTDISIVDQSSNQERNHQVRLMADIYGDANIVLVWLPSTGENVKVGKAFRFVHDAATCGLRSNAEGLAAGWGAVSELCGMRYWMRKWIIQEMIKARTVVLRAGKLELPMQDFETLCSELNRNKANRSYAYNAPGGLARGHWQPVMDSSAARLALQRTEATHRPGSQHLYELVERYAQNKCKLPCVHVYALYSLVGDYRQHLSIDYAASPGRRFVDGLHFMQVHDGLPPVKTLHFARFLMRLFVLTQEDLDQERRLLETLVLLSTAHCLGIAENLGESARSQTSREAAPPLQGTPTFWLDRTNDPCSLMRDETPACRRHSSPERT